MASVPDLAPFLRKPRVGPTSKARPFMKLEWSKLLAEATEKDVELKIDVDRDECFDDESEMEMESGVDLNTNTTGNQDERPLNLCHKSHTLPISGTPFPSNLDVLDLSAKKKPPENKNSRKSNGSQKNSDSAVLPLNEDSINEKTSKTENEEPNKDLEDVNAENKENYQNNVINVNRTPCSRRPVSPCESDKPLCTSDKVKSCSKIEMKEKQNLFFFTEKKPAKSVLNEKKSNKEIMTKKVDVSKKGKCEPSEKLKTPTEKSHQVKSSHVATPISQKFAVPATPKYKEASKVLVINKKSYQILAPLGKGGSSKVYLVLNSENELLAVKCVRLSDVSESTKNDYLNEIQHLMKMQHCKHVIRLYDHQYLTSQKLLLAVMERGETDLSRFLKDKASSDEGISPELIMYYWTEMLMAVKSIHDNNIIHRDLKPANFLLVSGRLKLIDFGIASSIQTEQTSILMESQSGTFNYMSPEALQDLGFDNKIVLKIGRKTDVWSLGCILYYFLYKKTPYQDIVKPLHKLKAITDPNYAVPFPKIAGVPDILIESCRRCLIHDTKKRASIEELLAFRNRPLFSLSQVLGKLEQVLSPEDYRKAEEAFEQAYENDD